MTLKKKEEPNEIVGKVENTPEAEIPADAKDYKVTVLFKNGATLTQMVKTTEDNLNEIGQAIANRMGNPTLHGSITMQGTILDLSEVVYFRVEE